MSAVIGAGRRAAQPRLGQSVIIEPGGGKSYLAPSRNAWSWSMRSTTLPRSCAFSASSRSS